jgi:hypothetical protein
MRHYRIMVDSDARPDKLFANPGLPPGLDRVGCRPRLGQ